VAGPFAEGTLGHLVGAVGVALDDDLRVDRDRQTGDRSGHDAIRRAAHAAGPVVLGDAVRDLGAGSEEEERVTAGDERDRHLLAAREPLVAMLATVLPGRDV